MTSVSPTSALDLDVHPGRPPLLRVEQPADALGWAGRHRDALRALTAEHGAVLVRGLGLTGVDDTSAVLEALAGPLLVEREAFAPRTRYRDGVYSSATWPANQPMCMHHELSYTTGAPGLALFACLTAPDEGGATGIADAAAVLEALPTALVDRFEREGWLLTRSYNDEIGASLTEAFGTEDRTAIEDYCRANGIEATWGRDGGLHTRQRRRAVVVHPATGRRCWFNQIAFLNQWTLDPEVRDFLVDVYGEESLPFNTCYGDGGRIGEDVVELLNQVYRDHTRVEPWQSGDLMIVDNVRTAHSREPFEGRREVLVAMAEPLAATDSLLPEAGPR